MTTAVDAPPPAPRWIEYLPPGELQPHPANPKDHAIDDLAAAVTRFDFTEPILLDERSGYIAAGHGRREVLIRLAETDAPAPDGVIVTDTGEWLVPVVRGWSSKDDEELRVYLFASNHLGPAGGWVNDVLAPLLQDLADGPNGLTGTGLTADGLDDLLAEIGAGMMAEGDSDAAYADRPNRGDPAAPRQVQGLHEVGLMFQDDAHREYLMLLAQLRGSWDADMPSPMVVLRAMRLAVNSEG